MTNYSINQLFGIGVISKRLKQVLVLLGCSTYQDMIAVSEDKIKVDYIEKSHHLRDELFNAISDIQDLEEIIPEFAESVKKVTPLHKTAEQEKPRRRKFKVGDFTEELLKKSDAPIKQDELLEKIKRYLPDTYIESIRANLNGDPQNRFVFFLDGYVGLREKEYDKRFQYWSIEGKKVQYAEQRIMEFLSFLEEKHRSPQPHGLDEEESLYRWYLDFTKSTSKELAELQTTFKEYLKEYDQWVFTPQEYAYKRNCDQVKWYVDQNLELPLPEDEPELSAWFNSQLGNYEKHKDKRKKMFAELVKFLSDYGMRFYDAKSAEGKAALRSNYEEKEQEQKQIESTLDRYISLFDGINKREGERYAVHKALLIMAVGNLIQRGEISTNEITLDDDLLTEFADVCIDNMGTASSYNIAIPYYYMSEEPFWSLTPKELAVHEESIDGLISFDYIERNFACSVLDNDLYGLLSDEAEFEAIKKFLTDSIISNKERLVGDQPAYHELQKNEHDEDNEVDDANNEVEEANSELPVVASVGLGRQLKVTRRFEKSTPLDSYLQEIGRAPLISCEEEKELFQEYGRGNVNAFYRLVNANLRFVVSIAKQYQSYGIPLMDLIQEGNIGLMKAIEKYDYCLGMKFISYATTYIRWHLKNTLSNIAYLVKIPVNKVYQCREIRKSIEQFEQKFQTRPSICDLGLDEELDPSEASSLVEMAMLDRAEMTEPLDEDALFADGKEYSPEATSDEESLNYELQSLLHFLDKREQRIICDYYGLDGRKEKTLETIGNENFMTRERVRQIVVKCLKILRVLACAKYKLRPLNSDEQKNLIEILDRHTLKRVKSAKDNNSGNKRGKGLAPEEITHVDAIVDEGDREEIAGTKENENEHMFLNPSGKVEGSFTLPVNSENRSGMPWSSEEEKLVSNYYNQGQSFSAIAKAIGRTEVAVMSRLGMMGVIDYTYGQEYKPNEEEVPAITDDNDEEPEEAEFDGKELAERYFYPVQDNLFWDEEKQVYETYLADSYELVVNHLIFDVDRLNEIEAKSEGLTEDEKEELFSDYWYDNHINIIARIKPGSDGFELLQFETGPGIQKIVYKPGEYTYIRITDEADGLDKFIDYNGVVYDSPEQIMATTNTEVARYHDFYDAPKHVTKEYIRLGMIEIKRIYKGGMKKVTVFTDSELGQAIKNNSEEIWMLDRNSIITKLLKDEDSAYPFKVYFCNGVKMNDAGLEAVKTKSLVLQAQLFERLKKIQASLKKKKEKIRHERQFKEIVSTLFCFKDDSNDKEDSTSQ